MNNPNESKQSHRPDHGEPWTFRRGYVADRDGSIDLGEERVKRLIACVNACAGLTDEELLAVPNMLKMAEACELAITTCEMRGDIDSILYRAAKVALRSQHE